MNNLNLKSIIKIVSDLSSFTGKDLGEIKIGFTKALNTRKVDNPQTLGLDNNRAFRYFINNYSLEKVQDFQSYVYSVNYDSEQNKINFVVAGLLEILNEISHYIDICSDDYDDSNLRNI